MMEFISNHRELELLDQLKLSGGACRIRHLAKQLQVTEQTVRRNVRQLEQRGVVRKLHGGVELLDTRSDTGMQTRISDNAESERAIGEVIARMISDGDSLFLDAGTMAARVVDALQDHRALVVITNSAGVANRLATRNGNRVYLAGGELRALDGAAFGEDALAFVRRFYLQYAVLSVSGILPGTGFFLGDLQEATLARAAISKTQTVIVGADASKFGRQAPVCMASGREIDLLATDIKPDRTLSAWLQREEIDILGVDR